MHQEHNERRDILLSMLNKVIILIESIVSEAFCHSTIDPSRQIDWDGRHTLLRHPYLRTLSKSQKGSTNVRAIRSILAPKILLAETLSCLTTRKVFNDSKTVLLVSLLRSE